MRVRGVKIQLSLGHGVALLLGLVEASLGPQPRGRFISRFTIAITGHGPRVCWNFEHRLHRSTHRTEALLVPASFEIRSVPDGRMVHWMQPERTYLLRWYEETHHDQ